MATSHDNSARKGARSRPTRPRPIRRPPVDTPIPATEVRLTVLRLQTVRSVVITAAAALWHQSADHDADIAHALRYSASMPLTAEIERLETLLARGRA